MLSLRKSTPGTAYIGLRIQRHDAYRDARSCMPGNRVCYHPLAIAVAFGVHYAQIRWHVFAASAHACAANHTILIFRAIPLACGVALMLIYDIGHLDGVDRRCVASTVVQMSPTAFTTGDARQFMLSLRTRLHSKGMSMNHTTKGPPVSRGEIRFTVKTDKGSQS